MFIGIGVAIFLLVFVIPKFVDVYAQSNASLPGPTQMLLDVVTSVVHWGPWAIGILLVSGIGGYLWSKTEQGQYRTHRLLLAFPLIGGIVSNDQIIRLSRTMATILAGGLPLLTALSMTADAMTNKVFSRALARATSRVREGMGLAASFKEERFLPRMTVEMIEVGEATGALETMLEEVAEFHESENRRVPQSIELAGTDLAALHGHTRRRHRGDHVSADFQYCGSTVTSHVIMATPVKRSSLEEILLTRNVLTAEQLAEAVHQARAGHRPLSNVLLENGLLTEDYLARAVADQYGLPYDPLYEYRVAPDFFSLIPVEWMHRLPFVPLSDEDERLTIAVADPHNLKAIDELEILLNREIAFWSSQRKPRLRMDWQPVKATSKCSRAFRRSSIPF